MAKKARDLDNEILLAAMVLVARDGWTGLSMRDLAAEAKLALPELRERVNGPVGVLRLLSERLDRAMLAVDLEELDELSPRERLFELFMNRFDAMAPFREGLVKLVADIPKAPELWPQTACNLDRMTAWMIDVADLPLEGLRERVGRQLLAAAYTATFKVWAEDDSEDLSKTLAELDKRLGQIERLARFDPFQRRGRGRAGPGGAGPDEAAPDDAAPEPAAG